MKWINIDKLPSIGDMCLILIDVGDNIERGEYIGKGNFKANWCTRKGKSHCYKVTHWMPLPEPPIN